MHARACLRQKETGKHADYHSLNISTPLGGSGSLVEGILQMLFVKNSMECRQRRREDPRTGSRATRCPEKKKSSRRREVWIPILARAHAGKLGCLLPTPSASSSICRGIGGKENGKRKKESWFHPRLVRLLLFLSLCLHASSHDFFFMAWHVSQSCSENNSFTSLPFRLT